MQTRKIIKEILDNNSRYRERLFYKGFIFSNQKISLEGYPFYGDWKTENTINGMLFCHKRQKYYLKTQADYQMLLIGHAYNPFTAEFKEDEILKSLDENKDAFFDYFNQLTGVFTLLILVKDKVYILGDPAGMQSNFYMNDCGKFYISTHENLMGDLLNLEQDDYVKKLSSYKYFPLLGSSLPGDLSQFSLVKRVIPNHYVEIVEGKVIVNRFFTPQKLSLRKEEIAEKVAKIMASNLELISKKWQKPAISLTGGCDSKTTLSCAVDIYDKFKYFSYVSSGEEKVDADAAHKICENLGLEHQVYQIPMNDSEVADVEIHRILQYWNTGALRKNNLNDVRKRVFFSLINDFDVEVKSWVSEVGRAYYSKRFGGRKKFGKITPRKCTTMYKFFFHNRKLVRQTDKVFKEYISKYMATQTSTKIEWQDLLFLEFRMSSWNGLVITGGSYSFDIAIPYNNRLLLELLLSASLEDKINDEVYKEIRSLMNYKIDQTGISVINVKHTKKRAKLENVYYMIHSRLPF